MLVFCFFFFKQKTAYEITEGDWSSDVCSSDLDGRPPQDHDPGYIWPRYAETDGDADARLRRHRRSTERERHSSCQEHTFHRSPPAGLSGKVVPDATAPSQRQLPKGLRAPAREAAGAAQCHLAGSLLSAGSRRRRQRDGGGATCCISRTTSPGSAWRPNAFLEKMRRPSTSTSNTPPDDWINFTSAWG